MICPNCHAEYFTDQKKCGECQDLLVDACPLDLPIPEAVWSSIPPFNGKTYADMVTELLEQHSIPYYLEMGWSSSALNIDLVGQLVRIFVPKEYLKKASELASFIVGESK